MTARPIPRFHAVTRLRPALLAPWVVQLPLLGLLLGALLPDVAGGARAALPVSVPLLVFAGVAAVEMSPPTPNDARTALLILAATTLVCPAVVAALAFAAGLPGDLRCAVVLAAASPAAMGAGVLSQRCGLPARPAIWAALLGLAAGPVLLPVAAAAAGQPDLLSPWRLAERAVLFGAGPALVALAARRRAPVAAAAAAQDLKGVVVLALGAIALASGGGLGAAFVRIAAGDGRAVLAVGAGAAGLTVAAAAAWAFGRIAGGPAAAHSLLVPGAARNASFAWAAAGGLGPHGDLAMAVSVAGAFVLPPLMMQVAQRAKLPLGPHVGVT